LISAATEPVVVLGENIAEASDLPSSIRGHDVVNAGIGGTTIRYFVYNAALLLREANASNLSEKPTAPQSNHFRLSPVAVATIKLIGPDASKNQYDASLLIGSMALFGNFAKGHTLVNLKVLSGNLTIDGIHLNRGDYKLWNAETVDDALLVLERMLLGKIEANSRWEAVARPVRIGLVFFCVSMLWIFFKLPNFDHALAYFSGMFTASAVPGQAKLLNSLALLYCLPVIIQHITSPKLLETAHRRAEPYLYGPMAALMCVEAGPSTSYIYFQF
jgi:hypothetical protein